MEFGFFGHGQCFPRFGGTFCSNLHGKRKMSVFVCVVPTDLRGS
jgi:hypothetical protein